MSTKKRAFFRSIKILVPDSWDQGEYSEDENLSFETADIRVVSTRNGDNIPFSMSSPWCAAQGFYLTFTDKYLTQRSLTSRLGSYGKTIVHEWAHYRWGVGDEYPFHHDERFYLDSNKKIQPVRCSINIPVTLKNCRWNPKTKQPNWDCVFKIGKSVNNNNYASIMSYAYLPTVVHFCENNPSDKNLLHNHEAPVSHNRKCNRLGTWDVMMMSEDFRSNRNPPNTRIVSRTPEFSLWQQKKARRYTLVLDVSVSMEEEGRLQKMTKAVVLFILETTVYDSISVVVFARTGNVVVPITKVSDIGIKLDIIRQLPLSIRRGGTCILCGLVSALSVVRDNSGSCGNIVVFTDGMNNIRPSFNPGPQLIKKKCVINAIFMNMADPTLRELAVRSKGRHFFLKDESSMRNFFKPFLKQLKEPHGATKENSKEVHDDVFDVTPGTSEEGIIHISPGLGNQTILTFSWSASSVPPKIRLESPSGCVYQSDPVETNCTEIGKTELTNFKILRFTIEGIAEPGNWRYSVKSSTNDNIVVSATSKPSDESYMHVVIDIETKEVNTSYGSAFVISARVSQNSVPVIGLKAVARLDKPDTTIDEIELFDNGGNADKIKSDGIYSGYFFTLSATGHYSVEVRVSNPDGTARAEHPEKPSLSTTFDPSNITENNNTARISANFSQQEIGDEFKYDGLVINKRNDVFPPSQITDLVADQFDVSNSSSGVEVTFTAPGDDLDNGRAQSYQVCYRIGEELLPDFERNSCNDNLPALRDAGFIEKISFPVELNCCNCPNSLSIAIGIRAMDNSSNVGLVSQVAVARYFTNASSNDDIMLDFEKESYQISETWQVDDLEAPCGGRINITSSVQTFSSPRYPSHYPNNADCEWTIMDPVGMLDMDLVLKKLDLESCCDFLEIYDGSKLLRNITGNARNIRFNGSSFMRLRLHTDRSVTSSGFLASVRIAPCGFNAIATDQPTTISSPLFPFQYPPNSHCEWNIRAGVNHQVQFTFNSGGEIEACCDYVEVFDGTHSLGRLNGTITSQLFIANEILRVVFRSNEINSMHGFSGWYVQVSSSSPCNQVLRAGEVPKTFTSPRYPGNYPRRVKCDWYIHADGSPVQINIHDVMMPFRTNDGVYVFYEDNLNAWGLPPGRRSLGTEVKLTSKIPVVHVMFRPRSYRTARGFRASYQIGNCGYTGNATETPQVIGLTTYPNNYTNNLNCTWHLQAPPNRQVQFRLSDGETEACCDYIKVFDGSTRIAMLSGLITEQVFTSTTGSLKVVFISDENTTNRGFTGQYYTEPCGGNYIANGSLQNISTTNYPGNYPNNLRCAWNITSTDGEILLTIYGLHGTRSEDYVTAFNGIRSNALRYRRTSDVRHFVSRGKRMDITFSSDHRRNSFGFQASFTLIACGRNYTANSTLQYISTPNYPNNYLSGLKCSWYISSKDQQVLLTILALNTGRGDYVMAYDEKRRRLIRTRSRRTPMNIISPSNFMRVYFDATGDTTGSGFFASYKAFTCGGTYRVTEVDQFITTPDYPNQYPRGITCNWYLQADPYKQVSILFIHHSTSGYSSSIQIYDGNHTRMGTLYRSGRNKYFSSKSSSIRVKFSSNNAGRGFNASFKIAPCGNTRDSVPQTRLIASPGYPGNYPNNANCEWTYYAARGKTIEFTIEGGELEECCDFVEVFNEDSRIARLTGSIPRQIFSFNQLRIKFSSNGNVTRRGFHGIVKRGSLSSRLIASSTPQYISSPNHPNRYPNNYVYDWYISAPGSQVQFTVVMLDTERCCDQIVVYDLHGTSSSRLGDLQGRAHNVTFISTTGQLRISFLTDSSITKSGFTAFYKKAPCERHFVATSSPQTLRYPWNDDRYGNDEDCRWTIRASDGKNIRLTILDGGSTEECCDFIEVFNGNTSLGRRSGQINKEIFESTESLLQIQFHSNANLTETGFSAEFVESPCGGWKTASNETQYFTSPNYPQHYPNNVSCGWVIVAQGQQPLEVTFEDLQIEKCCDSLEVYDYEFDRSNWKMLVTKTEVSTSYYSKSGLMKVMFTSDDSRSEEVLEQLTRLEVLAVLMPLPQQPLGNCHHQTFRMITTVILTVSGTWKLARACKSGLRSTHGWEQKDVATT